MIDHAGIIHMNGRIYDSKLGRFLQADPNVQAPDNSQNLNRYSYVLNNPLSYTDPSGFFFKAIGKFVGKYWRQLVAVGIGIVTAGIASGAIWASLALNSAASFGVAVAGGALAGYVSTGTLNGALIGAFSAAAFYGVGQYFDDIARTGGSSGFGKAIADNLRLSKTIAHGMTGGVMNKLGGGRFAHGFASAGTTQAFAKTIGGIGNGDRSFGITAARVTSAAIVGGSASELSGGKFANGAVTGAFSRAFNDELTSERELKNDAEKNGLAEIKKAINRLSVAVEKLGSETISKEFNNTEFIFDPDKKLIGTHNVDNTLAIGCHQCGTNEMNRVVIFPLAIDGLSKTGSFVFHDMEFVYGKYFLEHVLAHEIGHTTSRNLTFIEQGSNSMAQFDANQTARRILENISDGGE